MSDFDKLLISDLAKKYTFETFDFKNNSPQDLLKAYQQTFDKLENLINEQYAEISEHNAEIIADFL